MGKQNIRRRCGDGSEKDGSANGFDDSGRSMALELVTGETPGVRAAPP